MSDLFPYAARPHQEAMLDVIRTTLEDGQRPHLVMESPTGSGKTICTLAPCLASALETGNRIVYSTRTNSQQLQVMKELREVVKASGKRLLGIGIQGRGNMCLLIRSHPEWREGSPEEMSAICGDLKRISMSTSPEKGCPFYSGLLSSDLDKLKDWIMDQLPTIEELIKRCDEMSVCPYELAKRLMEEATIVVAPYIFIFHQFIRTRFLDWTKMSPDETVLVVDEAHNLPEFIRELRSLELGQVSLKRALNEAKEFNDPELAGGVRSTHLLKVLEDILIHLEGEYIIDEDGLVPPGALFEEMMTRLSMTSPRIQGLIKELMVHGEIIKEAGRRSGRLPRSYLGRVGLFLATWHSLEGEAYVRLIRRNNDLVSIQAYCMDPTVAGEVLCSMGRSVHISGTLSPLEEYRDSVGLPQGEATSLRSFPSPFPKENLLLMYSDDVTTQYETLFRDPDMGARISDRILEICGTVPCNTAVFFPSFEMMRRMDREGLSRELEAKGRRVFVEVQGDQGLLMDTVKAFKEASCDPECDGSVLFTVAGGRVSEGMDFPEKELELAIIVGIPYPRPTAKLKALTYYYDMRFGKGWDYIVKAPTERKILQTIGRLVRSETDIGAAVVLDQRALHFSDKLPDIELENRPGPRLVRFFKEKGCDG